MLSLTAALVAPGSAGARGGKTTRVSVSTAGVQGDGATFDRPSVSADGRFVAFDSSATNLVSGDTNGFFDVFVRDWKLHKTTRVSVSTAGVQGDGDSVGPSISADGRFVAFLSSATNLASGDTNGFLDVFVRDRKLHKTTRVSVSTAGVQGDGDSSQPSISADGRFVAFRSSATNLVSGDTGGFLDVFVRDRNLHKTTRVSVSTAGVQGDGASVLPSVSADGRLVAFASDATNLVSGDTNGFRDVFVRDRKLHKITRVSVSTAGVQGDGGSNGPSISADGLLVAFDSTATNLVSGDTNGFADVFVRDRKLHKITLVSVSTAGVQGDGDSFGPVISADGRLVAFLSSATNLVSGDTNGFQDVFVRGPLV